MYSPDYRSSELNVGFSFILNFNLIFTLRDNQIKNLKELITIATTAKHTEHQVTRESHNKKEIVNEIELVDGTSTTPL